VRLHTTRASEIFTTRSTVEGTIFTTQAQMQMQNTLANEYFMTRFTDEWSLRMMYVLMSLQLQLILE